MREKPSMQIRYTYRLNTIDILVLEMATIDISTINDLSLYLFFSLSPLEKCWRERW